MLVLADTACLKHKTIELLGAKAIPALESPQRLETIIAAIGQDKAHEIRIKETSSTQPEEHGSRGAFLEEILRGSHDAGYTEHLRTAHSRWVEKGLIAEDESILPECFHVPSRALALTGGKLPPPKDVFAQTGYYAFDMSTGICKDTWLATWASALLAVDGVYALKGDGSNPPRDVLALCRPPGHHCTTSMAGGYCYVNNAVIAVHAFRKFHEGISIPKVAILDIDFHHGNGTQDHFYGDSSVLYVSIHGEDEYPYYTGAKTETGYGEGEGFNCNFPLPAGSTTETYLETLKAAVQRIEEYNPQYIIISLGFDTFHTDPLGSFKIATKDYAKIASTVRGSASLSSVPAIILLEGGYVVERLGVNMLSFLRGWEAGL